MKRLDIVVLLVAFLVLFVAALAPALSGAQDQDQGRACAPPAFLESEAGYVICCCRTFTGMCCAEVAFCSGFVPGCFCTG